jgi:hypothetical protein
MSFREVAKHLQKHAKKTAGPNVDPRRVVKTAKNLSKQNMIFVMIHSSVSPFVLPLEEKRSI